MGLRLTKNGNVYVCECVYKKKAAVHVGSFLYTEAINKALKQSQEGERMSQPSGTVYGINHLGKACSLHASTTNIKVSKEHECLGSPMQRNSLVVAQIAVVNL